MAPPTIAPIITYDGTGEPSSFLFEYLGLSKLSNVQSKST